MYKQVNSTSPKWEDIRCEKEVVSSISFKTTKSFYSEYLNILSIYG